MKIVIPSGIEFWLTSGSISSEEEDRRNGLGDWQAFRAEWVNHKTYRGVAVSWVANHLWLPEQTLSLTEAAGAKVLESLLGILNYDFVDTNLAELRFRAVEGLEIYVIRQGAGGRPLDSQAVPRPQRRADMFENFSGRPVASPGERLILLEDEA